MRKRVPYFMRWDLVFAKTAGAAGSQTCRRFCGTSMERRRKGRAFCESDSAKDMQVFLQYVDGEAAQNLIEVSMAGEWDDISLGLLCWMMRMRAFGTCGKAMAKGCVIFSPKISNIPAQGIRNRPKDEAYRSSFGLCLLSCIVCIDFCRPYGMPGMLRGNA